MSEITKEGRAYAALHPDPEVVNRLLHLIEWIEVCEHTISIQKGEIYELQKLLRKRKNALPRP